MYILVSNIGSSSKKYSLFFWDKINLTKVFSGHFEYSGEAYKSSIIFTYNKKQEILENFSLERAAAYFMGTLLKEKRITLDVVSFRIVAPDDFFLEHRVIDDFFLQKLKETLTFDPLHIDALIKEVSLFREHFPSIRLLGISDTAFHKTISPCTYRYALPQKYHARSYGYHGLSAEYCVSVLEKESELSREGRYIVLHLGSGSSVTGLLGSKSIYNSFGMTPASGIPSSTRVGNIDPLCALRCVSEEISLPSLLYGWGGIKALSSYDGEGKTGTNDVRELLSRLDSKVSEEKEAALFAVSYYVERVVREISQAYFLLGGVDKIIFTGTIGFRSEKMRDLIIQKLSFLKLKKENYKIVECDEEIQMVQNTVRFYTNL